MRRILKVVLGVLFWASMAAAPATYGQGGATGAINGVVVDSSGGWVADASVQIFSTATDALIRKVSTGSEGTFVAALLPPGTYYAVVNKTGFSEARAQGIEVRVTETARVTIQLKTEAAAKKGKITYEVANVKTTNATTEESIGTQTVREQPQATQKYQQHLSLTTGAKSELNASAQLGRGNVRV